MCECVGGQAAAPAIAWLTPPTGDETAEEKASAGGEPIPRAPEDEVGPAEDRRRLGSRGRARRSGGVSGKKPKNSAEKRPGWKLSGRPAREVRGGGEGVVLGRATGEGVRDGWEGGGSLDCDSPRIAARRGLEGGESKVERMGLVSKE